MSLKYKLYQLKNKNAKTKDFWYARAVSSGVVRTKDLATRINDLCTVTEPDILAVISALVKEMNYQLKNGMRVHLDGFGSFKLGIASTGAKELKEFNPREQIKGAHVLFRPEVVVGAGNTRQKNFVTGVKLEQQVKVAVGKNAEKKPNGNQPDPAHP